MAGLALAGEVEVVLVRAQVQAAAEVVAVEGRYPGLLVQVFPVVQALLGPEVLRPVLSAPVHRALPAPVGVHRQLTAPSGVQVSCLL